VHGNRRYVKLRWIGLLAGLALALPSIGRAELVTQSAEQAVLAVAPDESPRVAYFFGRDLYVARRIGGAWGSARIARLPGPLAVLAGSVVEPKGRVVVLAEDAGGKWLVLIRGRQVLPIARARGTETLGPGGITLDARGRPAVAYAVRLSSGKTYLRLVTIDALGRTHSRGITSKGFPKSEVVPAAAPVLVGPRLHVVETYNAAAIDWGPKGKSWEGQYLYAGRFGGVGGPIGAISAGGTLYAALTLDLPQLGESNVIAVTSQTTQESNVVFPHALFVSLALQRTGLEIGANDFVETDSGSVFAALVALPSLTAELDGRLDGYAAIAEGSRYVLLAHPTGLEFYAVPALLPVSIDLDVTRLGDTVSFNGVVSGSGGGEVELYRETPSAREFVGHAQVRSDGSFGNVQESPAPADSFYRAVYREPTTGLPYASLLRSSCCASPPRS
jgi:hypothetical protein